ncbi:MAG: aldehyde dehydrogenase family protein [Nitrospirota bacterium]|nr:aldehyde dehydrogenase family protein [Nitrospirota bacterium]
MPFKIGNLIKGKYCQAASKETIKSLNPADARDVVGIVPASGPRDVDAAVAAAKNAFPAWSTTPAPKRAEIIYRAAEAILKDKTRLGRLVTREMGKILPEGLGDVQEAVDMAYYMAGEGRRMSGQTVPSELADKDCKSVRVPVGVFALITPWNFPTAIPAWKIFPALVAGNTVVLKPSSLTPVCAAMLADIVNRAGLPPGVLNIVHGPGETTGTYLAAHHGIDGISFTGSSAVGHRIATLALANHKEYSCEMGGKNPIIVMDDANLDQAVKGALWGAFGTTGQRCTAASRLIVHTKIYARFISSFVKAAKKLKLGDGLRGADVGPLISLDQMKKVLAYIEIGKKEGARVLFGGNRAATGALKNGNFISPTAFTDVKPDMRIAQEEIFGPVVSILKAETFKDAIAKANGVDYGLSSAIYTQNVNNCAIAERDLDTGIVYINAPTIGAEIQLPFGGFKKSGFGRKEAGGRGGALDTFTRWKVVYRDFSGALQKAQID